MDQQQVQDILEAQAREKKLPQWAQDTLMRLRMELSGLQKAHEVLDKRDYYIIPGPDFNHGEDSRGLFILSRNQATQVCALFEGDILLIGRKIR